MLLKFKNGMSVEIRQGEYTCSTEGETCQVGVFYPDGSWHNLEWRDNTFVQGYLNADELGKLLNKIAALPSEEE
jgi:hypothetical protein